MTDRSQAKPVKSIWQHWAAVSVLQLLVVIAISVTVVTLYDHSRYRSIVTIDIEAVMQHKLDGLQQGDLKLDQATMLAQSQRWAQQLDNEVRHIAATQNAIVFTRPAVIQGSIDLTQTVINKMEAR